MLLLATNKIAIYVAPTENRVDACPVACINPGAGANAKGTTFYWIDFDTCIDCGICLQVCPVEGAILPEEKAELQRTN